MPQIKTLLGKVTVTVKDLSLLPPENLRSELDGSERSLASRPTRCHLGGWGAPARQTHVSSCTKFLPKYTQYTNTRNTNTHNTQVIVHQVSKKLYYYKRKSKKVNAKEKRKGKYIRFTQNKNKKNWEKDSYVLMNPRPKQNTRLCDVLLLQV